MIRHYCYKITNNVNSKTYIGIHSCKGDFLDSDYFGSGIAQNKALIKYGVDNFSREVIQELSTREECARLERELVTHDFINLRSNYNLMTGGGNSNASFSAETLSKMSEGAKNRPPISEETREKLSYNSANLSDDTRRKKSESVTGESNPFHGKQHTQATKDRISASKIGTVTTLETRLLRSKIQSGEGNSFYGKTHSAESRKKISKAQLGVKLVEKTCPHCELTGRGGNMKRYHFDNCKMMRAA